MFVKILLVQLYSSVLKYLFLQALKGCSSCDALKYFLKHLIRIVSMRIHFPKITNKSQANFGSVDLEIECFMITH